MIYTPDTLPEVLSIRVDEEDIGKGGTFCRDCPVFHALQKCYPLEFPYEWAVTQNVIHLECVSDDYKSSHRSPPVLFDYDLPDVARAFISANDSEKEVEPLSFSAERIK